MCSERVKPCWGTTGMRSTVKMLTVMISSGALLSFQGAQACKAMNEAWRGSQRMFFRTGGAAGKARHACAWVRQSSPSPSWGWWASVAIYGVVGLSLEGGTKVV